MPMIGRDTTVGGGNTITSSALLFETIARFTLLANASTREKYINNSCGRLLVPVFQIYSFIGIPGVLNSRSVNVAEAGTAPAS